MREQHPKLPGSLHKILILKSIDIDIQKYSKFQMHRECLLKVHISRREKPAAPASKKVVSKEVFTPSPMASMQQTPNVNTSAPTKAACSYSQSQQTKVFSKQGKCSRKC